MVYYVFRDGIKLDDATCVSLCCTSFNTTSSSGTPVARLPTYSYACCGLTASCFGVMTTTGTNTTYIYQNVVSASTIGFSGANCTCSLLNITIPTNILLCTSRARATGCASICTNSYTNSVNCLCIPLDNYFNFSGMSCGDYVSFNMSIADCQVATNYNASNSQVINSLMCAQTSSLAIGACTLMTFTYPCCSLSVTAFGATTNCQWNQFNTCLYVKVTKYDSTHFCVDVCKTCACIAYCKYVVCDGGVLTNVTCCATCNDVSVTNILTGITDPASTLIVHNFGGFGQSWKTSGSSGATTTNQSCVQLTNICMTGGARYYCYEALNNNKMFTQYFGDNRQLTISSCGLPVNLLEYCYDKLTIRTCNSCSLTTNENYYYGYSVIYNKLGVSCLQWYCLCNTLYNLKDLCNACIPFVQSDIYYKY